MFKLCSVAALGVTQWWVGVNDAHVTQVLQGYEVFGLTQAIKPTPAESQRAKVLVDDIQKLLGLGNPASIQ